jgi:uncharacterized protein (DUF305 family)
VSRRRSAIALGGLLVAVALVAGAVVMASAGRRSDVPAASSVEVGFLRDMVDHHEQAVRMALLVIPLDGVSPAVRDVAVGIIASQRHDVGRMEAWLDDWQAGRGAPSRPAMAWMGHPPVAPADMPGMATSANLQALAASTAQDAERRFIDLMVEHHRAGVTMAEQAAARAESAKVVRLAELIAAGQQEEILELRSLRRQLDSAGSLEVVHDDGRTP